MHDRISYSGQMSRLTSRSQWVLLILAAANGGFLYFTPGLAEQGYAWAIKPKINAAFVGAGYLAGLLAFLVLQLVLCVFSGSVALRALQAMKHNRQAL